MPTVILLESDQLDESLAGRAPAPGLLLTAGRPLVQHAVLAFAACGDVERIVLAGPECYAAQGSALGHVDATILSDEGPSALIQAVIDGHDPADELVLWPANAPLIEPAMVEQFLAHAPRSAAVTIAMVPHSRVAAAFGPLPRIAAHPFVGREMVFPLLVCLKAGMLAKHRDLLGQLFATGPSRFDLLRKLGVGFAIKLKSGRATLGEVAARLSEELGGPAVLTVLPYAELCLRVATRAEHRVARTRLETLQ